MDSRRTFPYRRSLVRMRVTSLLFLVLLVLAASVATHVRDDTWAVIVNSSKFYLNYRHTANAMTVYHALKRMGLPDSRIILMHADCSTCDPRNPFPGVTYTRPGKPLEREAAGAQSGLAHSLYDGAPEVDYRDKDVTAESVLRVLTGNTYGAGSKQVLGSTNSSNVLVYLTGHGGDGFLKFHDQTELMSSDLGAAVEYMDRVGRYKNLLLVLDTCQASTMYEDVGSVLGGWAGVASSPRGKSSYAMNHDGRVGAFLVDEFTAHMADWLERYHGKKGGGRNEKPETVGDMIAYVTRQPMSSEVQFDGSKADRRRGGLAIESFFGGIRVVGSGWRAAEKAAWDAQLAP